MFRLSFRAALLAPVLAIAAPAMAFAQDDAADVPQWDVVCPQAQEGAVDPGCSLVRNILVGDGVNNQRLLTVLLQPDGADGRTLVLALPHGLYFPSGVQISVDGGAPTLVPVQTSDASGAYGGIPMTPELLSSFRAGSEMTVSFVSVDQEGLAVPVPLDGFSAGYDRMVAGQ